MRGPEEKQASMMVMMSPSSVVPADHPLRAIKERADAALKDMSPLFDKMYASVGRASVPPETLLKSQLLIALYTIRSERQFCEQLAYNLLFRWFLDMDMVSRPFDQTTFSKNRKRLLKHDACGQFFKRVVDQARDEGLLSSEHFSVDGTLVEAWASMKSFVRKDGSEDDPPASGGAGKGGKTSIKKRGRNRWKDFSGKKRSNETHASTTDPEARIFRKGKGQSSKLAFMLHALMENRFGFISNVLVTLATGTAEREAAINMLYGVAGSHRITVGGDKGYDCKAFIDDCKDVGATPHVAQNTKGRTSAIDGRTTRHGGYSASMKIRMRIEEFFGWGKTVGGIRRTRFKGRERTQMWAFMVAAASNLLRMCRMVAA